MDHPSPSELGHKALPAPRRDSRLNGDWRARGAWGRNEFQLRLALTNAVTVQVDLVQNHLDDLLTD
jgi:hypothetical protein